MSRRQQLVGLLTATALVAPSPSHAALNLPNKEADNATNAFIQERLRRTEEKKEERRVERLNDYYKRNFREYFEYEAGSKGLARRRGISDKTTDAMLKWLEENK